VILLSFSKENLGETIVSLALVSPEETEDPMAVPLFAKTVLASRKSILSIVMLLQQYLLRLLQNFIRFENPILKPRFVYFS
jgi:hypothetical protein